MRSLFHLIYQIYIAEKVFGDRPEEYKICRELWNQSNGYQDLFAYESCIRAVLGAIEKFPRIRILRKVGLREKKKELEGFREPDGLETGGQQILSGIRAEISCFTDGRLGTGQRIGKNNFLSGED